MNTQEREQLIASFLRHRPGSTDAEYESVEELDEIVKRDPAEALKLVEELLRRAPSDEARSYIAAGPLENLIRSSSLEFFTTIETLAAINSQFRNALGEVLVGEEVSPHIRARLAAVAKQP